jgi:hypothetical protein
MALPPFANGFQPFLRNNSDMLLQAGAGLLGGATAPQQVAGLAQGVAGARQKNKTLEFLRQQNPDLAAAVESGALSGGDAYKMFYQQKLESQKPKNNYLTAGKNIYDLDTKQWISPPGGADGGEQEYGLNPQYGVDAQGNPVILQLSKGGTSHQTALPPGVSLSKEPIKLDAGTEWVILDPITRQPVGRIPKNVAEAANQKTVGEGQGAATVALPGVAQLATQIDQQVKDLKTDPYLPSMVGSVPYTGGMLQRDDLPDRSPESQRVRSKIDQLKGGSFLQARQALKGGGAITDFEGQKADNAYNRMNTAQSLEDFNKALDDFNDAVKTGLVKLQQQSKGNFGGGLAPAAAPAVGTGGGVTSSGIQFSVEGQ